MANAKILVVEDEKIVAMDLKNWLKNLGYAVSAVVISGEEAIKKAAKTHPDLVLMDIKLRGDIDGIEAAEQIRAHFDIPVVYLTAYADYSTLQRAKITEPYGYILKPFEDRELHTIIEIALYKHKMERKLKENEEWLATTLKSIGDAVIATDTKGYVTLMNPVAETLTGWKLEDAVGKPLKEVFNIINEKTGKQVENPVKRVLREGVVVGLANHTILIAKDGTKKPIDDSGAPIKDDKGNLIGTVLVFRDITERKRAEEELRKYREHLEELVEVRTSELKEVNEQLQLEINRRKKVEEDLRQSWQEMTIRNKIAEIFLTIPDKGMYREVLQVILDAMKSKHGVFGYINQDGDLVCPSMTSDIWDQCKMANKDIVFPREKWGGIWGSALLENKTFSSNEPFSVPEGHIPVRRALVVPIIHQSEVIGHLLVGNKATDYDEKDKKLLETIANSIAPVLHARLQRDIHEREKKSAEELLASEKERLAVTLRSIGDGVITTDIEGNIVLMNKVAENLTCWTQEEAIGKPLEEVFHIINEKTREICENPVKKALKTGGIIGLGNNTVLVARDGTERIIADSGAPIRDKNGKIIGVVLVFRDITEKRKMEEDLLKFQKLESIGLLAGGIAHDFNNHLTAILGNITLAKMYAKPRDKVFEKLIDAEKSSLHAKDLTQQLLTFSKGGAPIKKTVYISELLRNTVKFALSGSNVECELSIPYDLWSVEIDEGQIGQVINNLIINADQAMPEGGIIKVKAENVTVGAKEVFPIKEGNYVKVSIEDNGIGIPKENIQKIFDPYFTTKQKGSGLGLTTSYSIIKKHDGLITVESEVGVGTTFCIYIPASQKEIKKVVNKMHIEGKGKILVMDDDKDIREFLGEVLNILGYDAELAKDGEKAIELYKKAKESAQPFDAVIIDLTIRGGMGGKETIQKLINIDPEVKAIVSSGYSNDPIMSDFRKYGFSAVITKPYTIEELNEILNKIIMASE